MKLTIKDAKTEPIAELSLQSQADMRIAVNVKINGFIFTVMEVYVINGKIQVSRTSGLDPDFFALNTPDTCIKID